MDEVFMETKRKPIRILLDSNAFFVPINFKIDIFYELKKLVDRNYELILISPVKKELEMLVKKKSQKNSKIATFALKLSSECKLVEIKKPKEMLTDDIIIATAKEWKSIVFTNDRELKRRLRNISVPVIYVRQKSFLAIDGRI